MVVITKSVNVHIYVKILAFLVLLKFHFNYLFFMCILYVHLSQILLLEDQVIKRCVCLCTRCCVVNVAFRGAC